MNPGAEPYSIRLAIALAGPPISAQTEDQQAELLKRQADLRDQAIIRKDRAAVEANMADDFRQIDGRGNVETRASYVEGLMSPELEIDP